MSAFSRLLPVGSLVYNFCWDKKKSSIDQIKSVTGERCNTHTAYHSVKGITAKIINTILLLFYYLRYIIYYINCDATKNNDTE